MIDGDALIVGGGIGGVVAALCLARVGINSQLFEQAASFAEVGAGIQLSPNCTRVLHGLGLAPTLARIVFLPEGVEARDWSSGDVVSASALGDRALEAYGFPYYHVHRADLMRVLSDAARAEPRVVLHNDVRVEYVREIDAGVCIEVGDRRFSGAVLVGADGIRSVVRAALFGDEAPTFTGNVAWRALVPVDRLPPGLVRPMSTAWWGPGSHFVHYYVRAGALVNCVCVVEKGGWEIESWTERGDHAELARDFEGWHPDLRTLIDAMDRDACFKWALFDRPPMPAWNRGRITLLGDACHPTLPFMAQGAAMAIEDGAVLARNLASGSDVASSLARYEHERRDRTARIQAGSRRNAKLFHLRGSEAEQRNRSMANAVIPDPEWLYGYDAFAEP